MFHKAFRFLTQLWRGEGQEIFLEKIRILGHFLALSKSKTLARQRFQGFEIFFRKSIDRAY